MAAAKIKKGDSVVVLSGKDKGKTGTVATAVMDLKSGTIHYTRGSPLHHKYTSFTIGGGSSAETES